MLLSSDFITVVVTINSYHYTSYNVPAAEVTFSP